MRLRVRHAREGVLLSGFLLVRHAGIRIGEGGGL